MRDDSTSSSSPESESRVSLQPPLVLVDQLPKNNANTQSELPARKRRKVGDGLKDSNWPPIRKSKPHMTSSVSIQETAKQAPATTVPVRESKHLTAREKVAKIPAFRPRPVSPKENAVASSSRVTLDHTVFAYTPLALDSNGIDSPMSSPPPGAKVTQTIRAAPMRQHRLPSSILHQKAYPPPSPNLPPAPHATAPKSGLVTRHPSKANGAMPSRRTVSLGTRPPRPPADLTPVQDFLQSLGFATFIKKLSNRYDVPELDVQKIWDQVADEDGAQMNHRRVENLVEGFSMGLGNTETSSDGQRSEAIGDGSGSGSRTGFGAQTVQQNRDRSAERPKSAGTNGSIVGEQKVSENGFRYTPSVAGSSKRGSARQQQPAPFKPKRARISSPPRAPTESLSSPSSRPQSPHTPSSPTRGRTLTPNFSSPRKGRALSRTHTPSRQDLQRFEGNVQLVPVYKLTPTSSPRASLKVTSLRKQDVFRPDVQSNGIYPDLDQLPHEVEAGPIVEGQDARPSPIARTVQDLKEAFKTVAGRELTGKRLESLRRR